MNTRNIDSIHSESDYWAALDRIEELMNAEAGTPELDELDVLATLVERYEEQNYPIEQPDPIELIKFRVEQLGFLM